MITAKEARKIQKASYSKLFNKQYPFIYKRLVDEIKESAKNGFDYVFFGVPTDEDMPPESLISYLHENGYDATFSYDYAHFNYIFHISWHNAEREIEHD